MKGKKTDEFGSTSLISEEEEKDLRWRLETCEEAEAYYGLTLGECPVCGAIKQPGEAAIAHKDPRIFKRN